MAAELQERFEMTVQRRLRGSRREDAGRMQAWWLTSRGALSVTPMRSPAFEVARFGTRSGHDGEHQPLPYTDSAINLTEPQRTSRDQPVIPFCAVLSNDFN
jgi:hypothetical protein